MVGIEIWAMTLRSALIRSRCVVGLATLIGTLSAGYAASAIVAPDTGSSGVVRSHVQSDSTLMAVADALLDLSRDSLVLWPAYEPPTEFMVCEAEGSTLAVLEDPPPQTWGPPQPIALQEGRVGYLYSEPLPVLRQCRLDFIDVMGRTLVVQPVNYSLRGLDGEVLTTLVTLVHEDFHLFQFDRFEVGALPTNPEEFALAPPELLESREFGELASLERELLSNALDLSADEELVRILGQYLAVRWKRSTMLPASFRGLEDHEERKEGSAHFVSYASATSMYPDEISGVADLIQMDLAEVGPLDSTEPAPGGPLRRRHIYATGGAIAIILDRLGVAWELELQSGQTFPELVATAIAWDESGAEAQFQEAVGAPR